MHSKSTWRIISVVLAMALVLATLTITAFATIPSITTTFLPNGTVGVGYSQALMADNLPYGWSVTTGSLPVGLSLGASSGVISGTPTVAGVNDFTVQATNGDGSSSAASLSITIRPVKPAFSTNLPGTKSATVGDNVTLIVSASGSGTLSYEWYKDSVSIGNNSATLTISNAQTGDSGDYKVQITNTENGVASEVAVSEVCTLTVSALPLSTDASLSALTISEGTLSPAFASGTTSYTAGVANSVASVTVTPTVNATGKATVKVNGAAVSDGTVSGDINLNVGSNTITVEVTAEDGSTTKDYTITVTRAAPEVVPVTGVSLDKSSTSIIVGATTTLTATVAPSNATNKAVIWSSNDATIASVSSTGVVTGNQAGQATITVTTTNGGKTATCTVIVIDESKVTIDPTASDAPAAITADSNTIAAIVSSLPDAVAVAAAGGADVIISVDVNDVSDNVPAVDQTVIEQEIASGQSGQTVELVLTIEITASAGGASGNITELSEPIQIKIPMPNKNLDLTYKVINVHNGVAYEYIDLSPADPNFILIEVDKFSTFAVVSVPASIPPVTYTVTFNANGGSVTPTSMQAGLDGKLSNLPTPTRSSYTFTGWFMAANGGIQITLNTVFTASTTVYAHWAYNGTSGDSSSGNEGSTVSSTPSNTPTDVTGTAANNAAKAAAQAAKASGASIAIAQLKNPGNISLENLQAMAKTAGMPIKVNADSISADGKTVEVRITLEPSKATKGLNLSAFMSSSAAKACKSFFGKYFNNTVSVISLGQQGSFGQPVEIAVKIDSKLNVGSLVFYSYNKSTNTYTRIDNPSYWVDKKGYVHFITMLAGDIVITDKPLAK